MKILSSSWPANEDKSLKLKRLNCYVRCIARLVILIGKGGGVIEMRRFESKLCAMISIAFALGYPLASSRAEGCKERLQPGCGPSVTKLIVLSKIAEAADQALADTGVKPPLPSRKELFEVMFTDEEEEL